MDIKNLTPNLVPEAPSVAPVDHSNRSARAAEAGRRVLQGLMKDYPGPLAVRLWNGETISVLRMRLVPWSSIIRGRPDDAKRSASVVITV